MPGGYRVHVRHVDGGAARDGRRRARQGDAGRTSRPAEVKEALQYLGTLDWKITSDPDPYHEKLLDVSRLGPRGVSVIGTK